MLNSSFIYLFFNLVSWGLGWGWGRDLLHLCNLVVSQKLGQKLYTDFETHPSWFLYFWGFRPHFLLVGQCWSLFSDTQASNGFSFLMLGLSMVGEWTWLKKTSNLWNLYQLSGVNLPVAYHRGTWGAPCMCRLIEQNLCSDFWVLPLWFFYSQYIYLKFLDALSAFNYFLNHFELCGSLVSFTVFVRDEGTQHKHFKLNSWVCSLPVVVFQE